jgi:hypothetical protein
VITVVIRVTVVTAVIVVTVVLYGDHGDRWILRAVVIAVIV